MKELPFIPSQTTGLEKLTQPHRPNRRPVMHWFGCIVLACVAQICMAMPDGNHFLATRAF